MSLSKTATWWIAAMLAAAGCDEEATQAHVATERLDDARMVVGRRRRR